ncbi:MAG: hypothetical protein A3I61_18740 [Acidobacteria bacterium RIFCSPLOWO2_02_FULL_68_18]|nr:MAG: hypothetical protein A3I61_18740 [Acidobacteria bacterium RIFCSPLOWO2_02_FULL_68_18]OFW48125.1 MAG: hypothetical protein A3G77_11350 [Acidobacteria bacterium RIFCSPLOWO2_12_FULL_68_19]
MWPLAEVMHFVGLALLIGTVGLFDLRLLGMGKGLAVAPVRRLLPWGVFGFVLCVASGSLFVGGLWANIAVHPYDVLIVNRFLQTKLIFIGLAGLNLLVFNLTGVSRAVDQIGPGEDAPPMAKAIAAASLFLWFGVIYVGRLIVWGNLSI